MIANHKQLIEKYKRQIEFKKAQGDLDAVFLLEQRIEEILERKKLKADRAEFIKELSSLPRHSRIHKVTDLKQLILSIYELKPEVKNDLNKLCLNVWSKQNKDVSEYYISFMEIATDLVNGHYVSIEEIVNTKNELEKNK